MPTPAPPLHAPTPVASPICCAKVKPGRLRAAPPVNNLSSEWAVWENVVRPSGPVASTVVQDTRLPLGAVCGVGRLTCRDCEFKVTSARRLRGRRTVSGVGRASRALCWVGVGASLIVSQSRKQHQGKATLTWIGVLLDHRRVHETRPA